MKSSKALILLLCLYCITISFVFVSYYISQLEKHTKKGIVLSSPLEESDIILDSCTNNSKIDHATLSQKSFRQDVQIFTITYTLKEETEHLNYDISIEYPVCGNTPLVDSIQDWICEGMFDDSLLKQNQGISSFEQLLIDDYFITKTDWDSTEEVFNFVQDLSKTYQSNQLITFVDKRYIYVDGWAHGASSCFGKTFKITDGHSIGWDMFITTENLNTLIFNALNKQYFQTIYEEDFVYNEDKPFPLPSTTPWIESDSIVFQYQEYEISAYYHGKPKCKIPIQQIKHLLNESVLQLFSF